jgi:5-methylcytosine-specific restriction endonuclease McrA
MSTDVAGAKKCSKCGLEKPFTEFYKAKQRDGYQAYCKDCKKGYSRQWAKDNPDKPAYYYAKMTPEQREHKRLGQREWTAKNKERKRESKAASYQRHRESNRIKMAAWYQAHKEEKRAESSQWRKNNRLKMKEFKSRRRARKKAAPGFFNSEQLKLRLDEQDNRCAWCSRRVQTTLHVEHIIPLSRNGTNWINNIVFACGACNSSKKDNLPFEQWYPSNPIIFVCELAHERLLEYYAKVKEDEQG